MNEALENANNGKIHQYLTFSVGDGYYALQILKVQEVIRLPKITKLPKAPASVKGVINIRGSIIPIVDLREKFNLDDREYNEMTRVIVVDIEEGHVGMVVDVVSRVIRVPESSIKPPPQSFTNDSKIVMGEIELDDELVIILAVEHLLSKDELSELSQVKESFDEIKEEELTFA